MMVPEGPIVTFVLPGPCTCGNNTSSTHLHFVSTASGRYSADDTRRLHCTGQQLSDLHVRRLPQQPHESRDAPAVLQGDFVVVVGFAVHQVPQGAARAAVHVGHPVVQQVDQQLDSTLSTDLSAAERRRKSCGEMSTLWDGLLALISPGSASAGVTAHAAIVFQSC